VFVANNGWIGVDLDATLAKYDGWKGPEHIGPPVYRMLMLVKRWLASGKDVRIFTARVAPNSPDNTIAYQAIKAWCLKHIGQELSVTAIKDMQMVELWDDRCVQVIPNTGRRVDGK
jgi:hypothetical protein